MVERQAIQNVVVSQNYPNPLLLALYFANLRHGCHGHGVSIFVPLKTRRHLPLPSDFLVTVYLMPYRFDVTHTTLEHGSTTDSIVNAVPTTHGQVQLFST